MLKPLSIGLASFSASLVLGSSADAMVLVQTQTEGVTIPSQYFTFKTFDAALGELLTVTFNYNLIGTDNAGPDGLCERFEDCDGDFQVRIEGSRTYSPLNNSVFTPISNADVDLGINETLNLTGSKIYETTPFIGDGLSFVPGRVSVFAQCVVVEIPGCEGHEISLTGTVSLTYEYRDDQEHPTPVPESSSLFAIAIITAMGVGHRLVNK